MAAAKVFQLQYGVQSLSKFNLVYLYCTVQYPASLYCITFQYPVFSIQVFIQFAYAWFELTELIALLQGKKVKVPTFLVPATQKVCHATASNAYVLAFLVIYLETYKIHDK